MPTEGDSRYRSALRSLVRGLWTGVLDYYSFYDGMMTTVRRYFLKAWNQAAAECDIAPDELTPEELTALEQAIQYEYKWIDGLAETVDIFLVDVGFADQTVEHIAREKDLAVVRSVLWDNQELLVKDGSVGVILCNDAHGEVHLTEDKDILIYTLNATPFLEILDHYGLQETEPVYVCQVPHFHVSYPDVEEKIESLKSDLGIEESVVRKREPDEE